jgi:hypothetical protein
MKLDNFLALNANFLNDYYGGCLLKCCPKSSDAWEWVGFLNAEEVDGGKPWIKLNRESSKIPTYWEGKIQHFKWDLSFPAPGAHNFKGTVIILNHIPVRSTLKGLHYDCLRIYNLLDPFRIAFPAQYIKDNRFEFSLVDLNLLEAMETAAGPDQMMQRFEKLLNHQLFATVITPNVVLSQGIQTKNPTVWVGVQAVGELNPSKHEIITSTEFVPELDDAFSPLNFKVSTKNAAKQ